MTTHEPTTRPRRSALFEPATLDGDSEVDAVPAPMDERRPLFSAPPRSPGTVVVECSVCDARTPVPATELALPVSLVLLAPWRLFARHPHRLRCPGCGLRTWCRLA